MPPGHTLIDRLARQPPDRAAARTSEQTWTFGELKSAVDQIARALNEAGLGANDRVVIAYPDGMEMLVGILATLRSSAVAIPAMHPVSDDRMSWLREEIQPALVLSPGGAVTLSSATRLELRAHASHALRADRTAKELPAHPADSNAAVIRFTSGSTGQPKGVVLDQGQLAWSAHTLSTIYGLGEDHRELVIAPMAFSGAWQRVAATLWGGGCIVFFDGLLSLPGILETVIEHRVTGFFTPPPMLRAMLAARGERVSEGLATCRSIEFGSAPLAEFELQRFADLVPRSRVFFHYGLTECSRATILDLRAHPEKAHTVGRPAGETRLEVRDADGRALAPGAHGQIHLSGPQRARAYWRSGKACPAALEWLATGDHGHVDEEGFLIYAGREDDLIVSGGFSFYPAEVESELGEVEGVTQYLIAGVEDPDGALGQVPWAFVVAHTGDNAAPRLFLAAARSRLPAYKVPRRVVLVPELPVTASGKPDRWRAVERFAAHHPRAGT